MQSASGGGGVTGDQVIGFIGTAATTLDYAYTANEALKEIGVGVIKLGATATRVLGSAGYVAAGANTYLNYKSMQYGEISGERFSYRTAATVAAIGVGVYFGAVPAALVGGLGWTGEKMYDAATYLWYETSWQISNFENALKSGWYPGK